jgi:alkylation response protein AidB-like acyl-CoA dehydrogenase
MDFTFNDEQRLLIDSLTRCLSDEATFALRQKTLRSERGSSASLWSTLSGLGVSATVMRESDGGLGGGAIELALICRLAGSALLLEPVYSGLVANMSFARYASPAHRAELAPLLCSGESLLVPAFDSARTAVMAATVDGGFRLSGQADVVYHATMAHRLLLAVSTTSGANADALICVRADAPGITLTPYITVDGQRAADVRLEGVCLTSDDIWVSGNPEAIEWALDTAMLALAADTLGSAERALALTIDYLKTRQQFGGPIGRFQALQHRVVSCLSKVEELRTWLWVSAARFDGATSLRRTSIEALKVLTADTAQHVGEETVQLHGGMGVTEDMEISHHFRRLVAAGIRYGSANQHLSTYAQLRDDQSWQV